VSGRVSHLLSKAFVAVQNQKKEKNPFSQISAVGLKNKNMKIA
jgi:hypothetical protein